MNPQQEIEAALARLEYPGEVATYVHARIYPGNREDEISRRLAALIRTSPPTPELLALVRAINGGATP